MSKRWNKKKIRKWNEERQIRYNSDSNYREKQKKWSQEYYWRKNYSKDFILIREAILKRDKYRCRLCKNSKKEGRIM